MRNLAEHLDGIAVRGDGLDDELVDHYLSGRSGVSTLSASVNVIRWHHRIVRIDSASIKK